MLKYHWDHWQNYAIYRENKRKVSSVTDNGQEVKPGFSPDWKRSQGIIILLDIFIAFGSFSSLSKSEKIEISLYEN